MSGRRLVERHLLSRCFQRRANVPAGSSVLLAAVVGGAAGISVQDSEKQEGKERR